MPWAKQTQNRAETVYKGIIDVVYKERDSEVVMREMIVKTELLKRDFTKRQLNILLFIQLLSYPYGKLSALIPNMQDFELCGVSKTKVREELEKLVDMSVIDWDATFNVFTIKNPTEWIVGYHNMYSDTRSQELFMINLKHANVDVSELMKKMTEYKK